MIDLALLLMGQALGSLLGNKAMLLLGHLTGTAPVDSMTLVQGAVYGSVFWHLAIWTLNFAALQGLTGSSVGKWATGLQIVEVSGAPITVRQSALRAALSGLSVMPLYLGCAPILWTERSQALHDFALGTVVIRRGVRYPVMHAIEETDESQTAQAA